MSAHSATDPRTNPDSAAGTELLVTGMNCNNCARHVTEAIQSVAGVRSATVTLEAGRATVRWDSGAAQNIPAIIQAVRKAGYCAKEISPDTRECCEEKPGGWQSNLWLGALCTVPLVSGEWVFGLGTARWFQWLSFALAGIVQTFAGARFYRGAWNQLKIGSSNMDTLVALGSTTAFAYSAWALLSGYGGHLYFMEAAAIITLISVGHWLEARMSERASSALGKLLNLAPPTARRRNRLNPARGGLRVSKMAQQRIPAEAGQETEVPVSELKIGDEIVLRPGDRVPTDGTVVEGDSAVDEAMLTGETVPVDKKSGSELYAGTVNLNGLLFVSVTAMGDATALAQIIAAVQRAQTSRANIQRLGDRVSSVFAPIVVAIAIGTALWWGLAPESARHAHNWLAQFLWHAHPPATALAAAFIGAAAVLIVACPCAMGLATPVAIMAGSNAAAQRGILIRDGVALEKAGTVTAVLFDKTGTLTTGKPAVAEIWDNPQSSTLEFQSRECAAALARHSTHPISQAIARLSAGEIEMSDWKEIRGAGVEAKFKRSHLSPQLPTGSLRIGSLRWLRETGVDLRAGDKFISEWSAQGASVVGLAIDLSLAGLFAVKDTLKPGARDVVRQLRKGGLNIYLVTGDNLLTAASLAEEAGIQTENVFAEIRPEQKAEFVKKLQVQGERVAFVGDGINDAPALEQADLGIAVSRASDIAREAADIILLNSEIEAVPEALGLARATLRAIKQNLFWAFFYNAIGVPLAALGFMSPILCAATMGLSDLVVIGNALRLRKWKMRI